jgi:GNAT superfamily N-acetyltransferase
VIRPLAPADVDAAVDLMHSAFTDLAQRIGEPPYDLTEAVRLRQLARISHLQRTDPAGAFAAEEGGQLLGVALALVRDGMWFLSLLVVRPGHQGKGLGRELLDAALETATDRSWILSTVEPAAVRRYQRAGFDLHPSYTAKGVPDRSRLPAVQGVRDFLPEDRETLDAVTRELRGAAMGPEVDWVLEQGSRILVVPGKGFSVLRKEGTGWLGATDQGVARDLLWATLAEAPGEVDVDWLTADQQWAIDVCLDAHLTLGRGASVCLRGQPRMSPYLPAGAFG